MLSNIMLSIQYYVNNNSLCYQIFSILGHDKLFQFIMFLLSFCCFLNLRFRILHEKCPHLFSKFTQYSRSGLMHKTFFHPTRLQQLQIIDYRLQIMPLRCSTCALCMDWLESSSKVRGAPGHLCHSCSHWKTSRRSGSQDQRVFP